MTFSPPNLNVLHLRKKYRQIPPVFSDVEPKTLMYSQTAFSQMALISHLQTVILDGSRVFSKSSWWGSLVRLNLPGNNEHLGCFEELWGGFCPCQQVFQHHSQELNLSTASTALLSNFRRALCES